MKDYFPISKTKQIKVYFFLPKESFSISLFKQFSTLSHFLYHFKKTTVFLQGYMVTKFKEKLFILKSCHCPFQYTIIGNKMKLK
jgi:hypothetical protein